MSDEKPFAEVIASDPHGRPVLRYGEQSWDPHAWQAGSVDDVASLRRMARLLHEAVEAREAKLRGALKQFERFRRLVGTVPHELTVAQSHYLWELLDGVSVAIGPDAPDYVSGDVACTYAFFYGMEQARTEGAWAVLFDALSERETAPPPEWLSAMAERLGVKPPPSRLQKLQNFLDATLELEHGIPPGSVSVGLAQATPTPEGRIERVREMVAAGFLPRCTHPGCDALQEMAGRCMAHAHEAFPGHGAG